MNPTDALKKLKGTNSEKQELMQLFISKAIQGTIEEWEGIMLEALKKELLPEKRVVDMSASMKGVGGARI